MRKRLLPLLFTLTLLGVATGLTEEPRRIVILGDSLSSGAGVRPSEAFPALLQKKVEAANLPFTVENAGVGGDTSAGGLRRIEWVLQKPIDILVIALGGNDGLRGLSLEQMEANLQAIIDKTKAKYPDATIVIAGMRMPPNLGSDYTKKFEQVFPNLAQKNNAMLIPFLLEGVGGNRNLNQGDLIHPTREGHRIIADVVWQTLEEVLRG